MGVKWLLARAPRPENAPKLGEQGAKSSSFSSPSLSPPSRKSGTVSPKVTSNSSRRLEGDTSCSSLARA